MLVSLALIAIAASLSFAGSQPFALLVFWAVIVGEELWAWRNVRLLGRFTKVEPPLAPLRVPAMDDSNLGEESEPQEPAADVLQQLTLRTTAEGRQELSGWLRLPLAAGQQTGSLHVAFCPAFDRMPQVEAEAVSGPDCRIKTAQVLPYGARLDVKLDDAAKEEASLLVWFSARNCQRLSGTTAQNKPRRKRRG